MWARSTVYVGWWLRLLLATFIMAIVSPIKAEDRLDERDAWFCFVRVIWFNWFEPNAIAKLGSMSCRASEYIVVIDPPPYEEFAFVIPSKLKISVRNFYRMRSNNGARSDVERSLFRLVPKEIGDIIKRIVIWKPVFEIIPINVISSNNGWSVACILPSWSHQNGKSLLRPAHVSDGDKCSIADEEIALSKAQSPGDVDNPDNGGDEGAESHPKHSIGPFRHLLLCFEIIGGALGVLVGFYGLRQASDPFSKGRWIGMAQAGLDGLLYIAVIVVGGACAVFGVLRLVFL